MSSTIFCAAAFFGLIATVVFAAVWVVQKIRHRETEAHKACAGAAVIAVVCFVAFGITYDPPERTEEPEAPSTVTEEPAEPAETPAETPAEDATEPQETPEESPANTSTPETEKPVQTPTEAPTTPPAETPEETEEPEPLPDKDTINAALESGFPEAYQDKWFFAYCSLTGDTERAVSVSVKVNLGKEDADAAQELAGECFAVARDAVEENGGEIIMCDITVVDDGAPLGIYMTADGKNYTIIQNGKRTQVTLP
jgi:type IV secretory pathway VirB10-like protein